MKCKARGFCALTLLLLSSINSNAQTPNTLDLNFTPVTPFPVAAYPFLVNYQPNITYRNFVRNYIPQKPSSDPVDINLNNQTALPCVVNTTYFDGLGRPLQEVSRRGVENAVADIVQVHAYDANGRESNQYLPYTIADSWNGEHGKLKMSPLNQLSSQYNTLYPGQEPFKSTIYDHSALERVMREYAPGHSWATGSGVQYTYNTNTNLEDVRLWTIGSNATDVPQSNSAYAIGTLSVSSSLDEDYHETITYQNVQGQVILKKSRLNVNQSAAHDGYACTYYVYDDLQRLRYVIPPQAVESVRSSNWDLTNVTGLCYRYVYDARGRMTEKQLPDKATEYMVYDNRDRLVLVQDGNMRANGANKWSFTAYDAMDRIMTTGMLDAMAGEGQAQLAARLADPASLINYGAIEFWYYLCHTDLTNSYMPNYLGYIPSSVAAVQVYSYSYYDDYSHAPAGAQFDPSYNSQLAGAAGYAITPVVSSHVRGMLTGSEVRVMDPGNQNNPVFLTTTNFYDDKAQLIQQQAYNIEGGLDVITNQYDFQGTMASSVTSHHNPRCAAPYDAISLVKRYTKNYLSGAVKIEDISVNGAAFRNIYSKSFDPLNRVANKKLGGAVNNAYTYNIRGWLTGINKVQLDNPNSADFFHERLYYDEGFTNPLYSGNISGLMWRGAGQAAPKRFYGYDYDQLSRLTGAEFGEEDAQNSGHYIKTKTDYTVSNITYDYNGNLQSMNQRGPGPVNGSIVPVDMDILQYQYLTNSNQLLAVSDNNNNAIPTSAPDFKYNPNGNNYRYDANGNQEINQNKDITLPITYSYLNKPEHIQVDNQGTIDYLYDAQGNKLRKTISGSAPGVTVTDYIGPFVYEKDQLKYILHEEGRIRPDPANTTNSPAWLYEYFVKDHLNNVRTVVNVKETIDPPLLYKADLEVTASMQEGLIWGNLDDVRADKPDAVTPADVKAAELNGSVPEKRIGTSIMLRVMPGDRFKVGAESYYDVMDNTHEQANGEQMVASLLNALTGGSLYNGTPVAELGENMQIINGAFNNNEFTNAWEDLIHQNYDPQKPAAFINYAVFDQDMHLTPASGVIQSGGSPQSWHLDELTGEIEIGQQGYLAVWTANKGASSVFYDKVKLTYYRGNVVDETDHYYPFGLTLSGKTINPTYEKNNIKFQSQRLEDDFGLNCYDYKYRMHDMQTGRFWQHDPLSVKYTYNSPYAFSENKVTSHIELEGLEAVEFQYNYWTNSDGQQQSSGGLIGTANSLGYGDNGFLTTFTNLDNHQTSQVYTPDVVGTAPRGFMYAGDWSDRVGNTLGGVLQNSGAIDAFNTFDDNMRSASEVGFRFKFKYSDGTDAMKLNLGFRSTSENNVGFVGSMGYEKKYAMKIDGENGISASKKKGISIDLGFYWKHQDNSLKFGPNKTVLFSKRSAGPFGVEHSTDGVDEFTIGLDKKSRNSTGISIESGAKNTTERKYESGMLVIPH